MSIMEAVKSKFHHTLEAIPHGGLRCSHAFHNLDTAEHMRKVVEVAYAHPNTSEKLVMAAMLHDIAKLTTAVLNEDGGYSFPKHDKRSGEIAEEMGVPTDVAIVVKTHSWIYNIHTVKQKSFNKFVKKLNDAGEDAVQLYIDLAKCDAEAFSPEGREQRLKDIEKFEEFLGTENKDGHRISDKAIPQGTANT
jgi:predicted HD phosphohydrolase